MEVPFASARRGHAGDRTPGCAAALARGAGRTVATVAPVVLLLQLVATIVVGPDVVDCVVGRQSAHRSARPESSAVPTITARTSRDRFDGDARARARLRLGGEHVAREAQEEEGWEKDARARDTRQSGSRRAHPIDWNLVARRVGDGEMAEVGRSVGSNPGADDFLSTVNPAGRQTLDARTGEASLPDRRRDGDGDGHRRLLDPSFAEESFAEAMGGTHGGAKGWAWWRTPAGVNGHDASSAAGATRIDGASRHARLQRMRQRLKGTREGVALCEHIAGCAEDPPLRIIADNYRGRDRGGGGGGAGDVSDVGGGVGDGAEDEAWSQRHVADGSGFGADMVAALAAMRGDGCTLCDVRLAATTAGYGDDDAASGSVHPSSLRAHAAVLAASSATLRRNLSDVRAGFGTETVITIEGTSAWALATTLEWAYTGRARAPFERLPELAAAAAALGMRRLEADAADVAAARVTEGDGVVAVRWLAALDAAESAMPTWTPDDATPVVGVQREPSFAVVRKAALVSAARAFPEAAAAGEADVDDDVAAAEGSDSLVGGFFARLEPRTAAILLAMDGLRAPTELDVMRAALDWSLAWTRAGGAEGPVARVLGAVRFGLIPRETRRAMANVVTEGANFSGADFSGTAPEIVSSLRAALAWLSLRLALRLNLARADSHAESATSHRPRSPWGFDPTRAKLRASLSGHTGDIVALDGWRSSSPAGLDGWAVSGSRDGTVNFWSLAPSTRRTRSGRTARGYESVAMLRGLSPLISSLVVVPRPESPAGREEEGGSWGGGATVAVGDAGGGVTMCASSTWTCGERLDAGGDVRALAVLSVKTRTRSVPVDGSSPGEGSSPGGEEEEEEEEEEDRTDLRGVTLLVSGGHRTAVRLWAEEREEEDESGEKTKREPQVTDDPFSSASSGASETGTKGGRRGWTCVAANGEPRDTSVSALVAVPGSGAAGLVVGGTPSGDLRVWRARWASGRRGQRTNSWALTEMGAVEGAHRAEVRALAAYPVAAGGVDGFGGRASSAMIGMLLSASDNGRVSLWTLSWSPDGTAVSVDHRLTVRHSASGSLLGAAFVDTLSAASTLQASSTASSSSSSDAEAERSPGSARDEGGVNGVAWVQGGAHFVSAGDDGMVRVWSTSNGSHVRVIGVDDGAGGGAGFDEGRDEGRGSVRAVAIVGDKLITGGTDEMVKVYQ